MAINDNAVYFAEYGTIFYADPGTALPASGLKGFHLTDAEVSSADTGKKWKNLGHTSNSNKIEINLEGGESESFRSWLKSNLKTKKSSDGSMTITANALQMDAETLQLIFNGTVTENGVGANVNSDPKELAIVIITQETQNSTEPVFGFHFAKTKGSPSGAPQLNGDFIEQGVQFTVESPGTGKPDFEFLLLQDTAKAASTTGGGASTGK